jgi:hypothetical protein
MSYITDEDHKLHSAAQLLPYQVRNPDHFDSPEAYLKDVATSLATYARLAFRHGMAAQAQSWVYVSGLSDAQISSILRSAAQTYVGDEIKVSVSAHTASMSQGETSVNLALILPLRAKMMQQA